MDWSTFVSDFTAGFLGAVLGLVVALQIDHVQTRRRAKKRDRQVLQALIDRLAGRRAFSHDEGVGPVDNPPDMRNCNKSVLDIRDWIASTATEIENAIDVLPALRRMESDCAAYLNYVERKPLRYAISLLRLRDRLHESELEIARTVQGLQVRRPGDGNAVSMTWLTSE